MLKLLWGDNVWTTISKLARKARRKHVAVAYIGEGGHRLLPLSKGDTLLVDFGERTVKGHQTNPIEIEWYLRKGVKVYTCSNLHAKTYIFDRALIVSSANVSSHSKFGLMESGILCRDMNLIIQARGWMRSLQLQPVTPERVNLMKKLYRQPSPRPSSKAHTRKAVGPRYSPLWLLGTVSEDWTEEERTLCEKEQLRLERKTKSKIESIRWRGKSSFTEHVTKGDLVVIIHTDPKRRKRVYPPCLVARITRYRSYDRSRRPRMFIHLERPKHLRTLSSQDFKRITSRAGLRNLGKHPEREIKSPNVVQTILGLWR